MNETVKNILGVLLGILVFGLIAISVFEIKNRFETPVDYSKIRTVSMSAEGKITAQPDTAAVSFSVVTTGKTADEVQKENDRKMTVVIDFLKSNGVKEEDIKTANYNLYPQYDYYSQPAGEQPKITGYNLNQNVTAKVRRLDSVGQIMGGLTGKGVNQIDNLSYFIDDPDSLKAEAREKAIEKAKEKAQELAAKLGFKLGKVVNFTEGEVFLPSPYPAYYDGRGAGGAGASPVEPGSQDVTVSVTLTFELK